MKYLFSFLLLGLTIWPGLAQSMSYVAELESWHQKRIEKLTRPNGYLSLVGLEWLGAEPKIIDSIGKVWLEQNMVKFELLPGFSLAGRPVEKIALDPKSPEEEQVLENGDLSCYVISRDKLVGLGLKDKKAPTLVNFKGVSRFPIQPQLRLTGTFIAEATDEQVGSVIGVFTSEKSPGWAEIAWQGKVYRLKLLGEPEDKSFFLVFSDATAGVSSYDVCRFLEVERVADGSLVLDFNKATNPACAFTPFATCPLPPTENILPFAIPAGESYP